LFKESKTRFQPTQKILADTGYVGIKKLHANTEQPKKRSKKNPLTKEDKAQNKAISSKRVFIENIIGDVKKYRIVSKRYRNRRKRFSLRFNLVAAIQNHEIYF
jgi:murein L,D-transpeptidase YcbB/YkuD